MRRLVIATTNPGKVIEIQSAIGELPGWSLEPIASDIPSIEETGTSFLENAILKAEHYSRFGEDLTLADDSGLCVAALEGRPGVHSARYAPDPPSRIDRILREMQHVPDGQRDAVFYCALAVGRSGQTIWTVQCDVAGIIAHAAAGTGGFGYDPVFFMPKFGQTMAQLSTANKDRYSARGQAIAELRKFLASL